MKERKKNKAMFLGTKKDIGHGILFTHDGEHVINAYNFDVAFFAHTQRKKMGQAYKVEF